MNSLESVCAILCQEDHFLIFFCTVCLLSKANLRRRSIHTEDLRVDQQQHIELCMSSCSTCFLSNKSRFCLETHPGHGAAGLNKTRWKSVTKHVGKSPSLHTLYTHSQSLTTSRFSEHRPPPPLSPQM